MSGVDLIAAVQRGDVEDVMRLLSLPGLDASVVNEVDESGYSCVHWAAYFDEPGVLNLLLKDARVNIAVRTKRGMTCLHQAACNNALRVLDLLLAENTKLLNERNEWGETALHLAAASGNERILQKLLQAGAGVNILDAWDRTPLQVAMEHGENSTISALRNAGGVVHGGSTSGDINSLAMTHQQAAITAEFMQKLQLKKETFSTAGYSERVNEKHIMNAAPPVAPKSAKSAPNGLLGAIQGGLKLNEMKEEAVVRGVAKQSRQQGQQNAKKTPLSKLVEFPGDVEKIRELLEGGGVDAAGTDMFGLSALHKFASWDKTDLLEMLLPHLLPYHINAIGGDEGFTALHYCVQMGALRALERLLQEGSLDKEATDKHGRTALQLSESKGTPWAQMTAILQ